MHTDFFQEKLCTWLSSLTFKDHNWGHICGYKLTGFTYPVIIPGVYNHGGTERPGGIHAAASIRNLKTNKERKLIKALVFKISYFDHTISFLLAMRKYYVLIVKFTLIIFFALIGVPFIDRRFKQQYNSVEIVGATKFLILFASIVREQGRWNIFLMGGGGGADHCL